MNAAELASALGGVREGRGWRCHCPSHGGRSLVVADDDRKLLVHCFGGCGWQDVFAALRSQGLIGQLLSDLDPDQDNGQFHNQKKASAEAEIEKIARAVARARDLYRRSKPANATPVETYLRSRGSTLPIPPVLRFLRYCPHRNGKYYPAMVAPIVNVHGELIASHNTFLKPDGSGKADLPKEEQRETVGPFKGGTVRLSPHRPNTELLIGTGIETTIAAIQLFELPGWSAVCDTGLKALDLPSEIRSVLIAADNDTSGSGHDAALSAHVRWTAEGRPARIFMPPNQGEDFNNVLLSRSR